MTSQNLVTNPSFEEATFCPNKHGDFNNNVKFWSTPTNGTSDYFNQCSSYFSSKNPHGTQKPHDKKAYAGIVTYYENKYNTLKDYREYLQGELKTRLTKGQVYQLKIRISLADKANFALDQLSLVLLEEKLRLNNETHIDLQNTKQKHKEITFKYPAFFSVKDNWMTLEKTFVAKGFESFICFGNFKTDANTNMVKVGKNFLPKESYYYVDNISVTPIKNSSFKTNKKHVFKKLLFDFDKAELINNSTTELDKLYNYVKTRPKLTIEIYGHTDNIGTAKRNQELSLQRAKSVAFYLINKGLNPSQIKWFGFGAKFPIAKNDSQNNRTQNRRVEFKLFKN